MATDTNEILSAEALLALAHTPPNLRDALRIFLELDARIGRIVAATTEPMLGQMRLAWWRETLSEKIEERPQGDPVLEGIGAHWSGHEKALVALVDGWEEMLGDAFTRETAQRFGEGRAAPFEALAQIGGAKNNAATALACGRRWALVDAALHVSGETERELLLELARPVESKGVLPRPLRGLSILDALTRRSLQRGGRPLMEGRTAALTALRAAIIGR